MDPIDLGGGETMYVNLDGQTLHDIRFTTRESEPASVITFDREQAARCCDKLIELREQGLI